MCHLRMESLKWVGLDYTGNGHDVLRFMIVCSLLKIAACEPQVHKSLRIQNIYNGNMHKITSGVIVVTNKLSTHAF